ncbi:MAG: YceD family protein [Aurantibacter sp.]
MHNKLHNFEFEVDEVFFNNLEQDLVSNGTLKAKVDLDKNDSFIGMNIKIEGTVELTCDRSLEQFQYPINEYRKVIFKYGDEERELDHDVVMITPDTQQIDVGQYIFEFVGLAVPMKKLHPRFEESEDEFGSMVYSSEEEHGAGDSVEPDPRWKKLNDLKKN